MANSKNKKGSQRGSQKRFTLKTSNSEKITPAQADVLKCYTQYNLSPIKIALRRKTSVRAVYKILNKLAEKGLVQKHLKKGFTKIVCTPKKTIKKLINKNQNPDHFIRLHFLEVYVRLIYDSKKYHEILRKSNIIKIYGNTIRLSESSIEIYLTESASGEDVSRATAIAFQLLYKVINKLENDLNIILIKDRVANAKIVNWHYSETDNELARDLNAKRKKLRIYSREDGILWFLIDDSYNLKEAECVHPETAKEDMQAVKDFFDDLRQKPTTMSRMERKIDKVLPVVEAFSSNIELHLDVMKDIKDTLAEMREEMRLSRFQKDTENLSKKIEKLRQDSIKKL